MAKIRRVLKKVGVKPSKVQEIQDFGKKGAPLNTQHPFYFGFLAASGALVAIALLRALQSASQVFVEDYEEDKIGSKRYWLDIDFRVPTQETLQEFD